MREGNHIRQRTNGRIQNNWKVSSGVNVILYFSSNLGDYISKKISWFLCMSCEVSDNLLLLIKQPSCSLPVQQWDPKNLYRIP